MGTKIKVLLVVLVAFFVGLCSGVSSGPDRLSLLECQTIAASNIVPTGASEAEVGSYVVGCLQGSGWSIHEINRLVE